ncbi:MAG: Crp/Fnr family transcriptional regulator [Xanthobacteraceae bacterium]|nr:Crp/Fnr family transcriptional regulator [Xanthobacteraceae bacterium]
MDKPIPNHSNNQFLALLQRHDFALLEPYLKNVTLERNVTLFEEGDEVSSVYFPLHGMISLLVNTSDGDTIEAGIVGVDGVAGGMAGLGIHISPIKAIVQIPGTFAEIPAARFRTAAAKSEDIRGLCVRYNEVQLIQARVTVACNALHTIEQRFCRWLLQSRNETNDGAVPLTQEFMAQMLGVQRSSVSQVATKMQRLGYISYVRGLITILNHRGLEDAACDCLDNIRHKTAVVWPSKPAQ